MAQEILDDGACKARGFVSQNGDVASYTVRGIGITAAERIGVGATRLTLLEPVGVDEFFAKTTCAESADRTVAIERIDDTTIELRAFNTAGAPAETDFWFDVYRLGADQNGLIAESPP